MNPTALRERPERRRPRAQERRPSRPPAASAAGPPSREVTLADRYRLEEGRILLTGVQALVRLPLDQHRADRRLGLHTGTLVSGYQGSPLGGLDQELQRQARAVRRAPRAPRARPERGAGRHVGVGKPAGRGTARLPLRRRAGPLVRQGAGARPRGRLPAARQLRRRFSHRRRDRRGGRRSRQQVVHPAERLRVAARGPAHAGVLPGRRAGRARPRPPRLGVLAGLRALELDEDRDQRGRRARHRRRGARAASRPCCPRSSGAAARTRTCPTATCWLPPRSRWRRRCAGYARTWPWPTPARTA